MKWLTFDNLTVHKFQIRGSPPQYLEFPAELHHLAAQIPTPPHFEESGLIPGPSYQWYGRTNDRPLIVEREKEIDDNNQRVFVHTSYLSRQDQLGDWSVLGELSDLPASILVTRPRFILSRTTTPKWVVFRPDPAGWNSVIYNASSEGEAQDLLDFLNRDESNSGCFIGPPEPEGLWSAIRTAKGRDEVLCTYPTRSAALSVACVISSQSPSEILLVKDRSNANPNLYLVSGGQVIQDSSGSPL